MPLTVNSTRFPFINLEKAIRRAEELYNGDRSAKPMNVSTAFELWGYSPKSSGGFQTVGALKMYGLLEDDGANEDRRVRLTDAARRYFLDERDDTRSEMLKDFALAPPLFNALWSDAGWSEGIPADTVARSHLKLDRNLNDQSARSLLSVFKDNVRFAGLRRSVQGEALVDSDDEQGEPSPAPPSSEPKETQVTEPARAQTASATHVSHHKPVMFDMERVFGQYEFDNADDLDSFIKDLEKIKPLLRSKPH